MATIAAEVSWETGAARFDALKGHAVMGRFEGFGDLLGDSQRLIQRDRPLGDPVGQGRPFHQLQHQRTSVLGLLDAVDRRDVGMVEAGKDLRLALESGEPIWVSRKRFGQDLQRHLAVQRVVSVA